MTGMTGMTAGQEQAFRAEIAFQPGAAPLPITHCTFAEEFGIMLVALDLEAGKTRIAAALDERWVNGNGVIQGGVVAGILDFAMAFTVLARRGSARVMATTNLDVAYLRPAYPGRFEATAELISLGRSVAFLRAEMFGPNGKCVATATSTGMVRKKE
jgi:uncharacterized protein (TIGR00369 family)